MRYSSPSRGVTLIEVLVYAAVLVTLATALVASMISLRSVLERNARERALATAAGNVMERFTRDVRDADSVNVLLSTLQATSSVLVLESGATTTTYSLQNGALMLEVEGAVLGALTPDDVRVTKWSVVRYDGSSSDMVRAELELSVTGKYASSTETFALSSVLRGSYEE